MHVETLFPPVKATRFLLIPFTSNRCNNIPRHANKMREVNATLLEDKVIRPHTAKALPLTSFNLSLFTFVFKLLERALPQLIDRCCSHPHSNSALGLNKFSLEV